MRDLAYFSRQDRDAQAGVIGVAEIRDVPAAVGRCQLKDLVLLLDVMTGHVPAPQRGHQQKGQGQQVHDDARHSVTHVCVPAQQEHERGHHARQGHQAEPVASAIVEKVRAEDRAGHAEPGRDEETALHSPDRLDLRPPGQRRWVLAAEQIERDDYCVAQDDNGDRVEGALHPEQGEEGIDAQPGQHEQQQGRGEAVPKAFGDRAPGPHRGRVQEICRIHDEEPEACRWPEEWHPDARHGEDVGTGDQARAGRCRPAVLAVSEHAGPRPEP